MSDNKQMTIQAKYVFTKEEKTEIATKLAQRQGERTDAELEKRTVLASFQDKIKRIILDIERLSRGYRDGYEYRQFEVYEILDYKKREKLYKSVIDGTVVDRKPFAPGDEQRKFA